MESDLQYKLKKYHKKFSSTTDPSKATIYKQKIGYYTDLLQEGGAENTQAVLNAHYEENISKIRRQAFEMINLINSSLNSAKENKEAMEAALALFEPIANIFAKLKEINIPELKEAENLLEMDFNLQNKPHQQGGDSLLEELEKNFKRVKKFKNNMVQFRVASASLRQSVLQIVELLEKHMEYSFENKDALREGLEKLNQLNKRLEEVEASFEPSLNPVNQ